MIDKVFHDPLTTLYVQVWNPVLSSTLHHLERQCNVFFHQCGGQFLRVQEPKETEKRDFHLHLLQNYVAY